ncbi:MAG: methyl viologen-reducing hydrogenase [Desulfobulbaceae bacterium A2]|nr:MAG: methyl viologen-reducing hydrogenase [Desulfobulbaceae bacterium A2]
MAVRVAEEWLHSCSGCEIAILNIGEPLVELLSVLEFVHIPVLMDHKYFGQLGDQEHLTIPEADVGIVSGGCANAEHKEVLEEMRKKCKILIALGTCATHGGLPALINSWGTEAAYTEAFSTRTTDTPADIPDQGVPKPLDRVYALDEIVPIDLMVPGCPPNPEHIAAAILALLEGKEVKLPSKSVCDTCPTIRKGKGDIKQVRRFVTNADFDPNQGIEAMRCLLEQGFMCMGPVTVAGCARRGAPSCISARVPCRGCYGPVLPQGNQMLDMMNALASNGIDFSSVVDRKNLLRFSGAHNKLRNR